MTKRDVRSSKVVIFQRDYGDRRLLQDEWDQPERRPEDHILRRLLEAELLRQQTPLPSFADRKAVLQFFEAVAVCDRIADDSGIRIRAVLDYEEYTADIELSGIFLDIGMEDYLPHFGLILARADQLRFEAEKEPFTVRIRMPYFKDAYLCP